jgi:hypothetical protein
LIGRFSARHSDSLGKNVNKSGVKLSIWLGDAGKLGISENEIRGLFKDIGKGLDNDQRIDVEFLE